MTATMRDARRHDGSPAYPTALGRIRRPCATQRTGGAMTRGWSLEVTPGRCMAAGLEAAYGAQNATSPDAPEKLPRKVTPRMSCS